MHRVLWMQRMSKRAPSLTLRIIILKCRIADDGNRSVSMMSLTYITLILSNF